MAFTGLVFIIALGVLIFFHELGHFLAARFMGVGVDVFSLGFGPALISKKIGRTDYRVCAVPLGGYVKMVGEEPGSEEEVNKDDEALSFFHKPVWKRIVIVASGPVFNLILALIILFVLYFFIGTAYLTPEVGGLTKGGPAEAADIRVGDMVVSVAGTPIKSFADIRGPVQKSGGAPLDITVDRSGEKIKKQLTPVATPEKNLFGEQINRYLIGINSGNEWVEESLGPLEAADLAVEKTWFLSKLTIEVVAKIFQGVVSPKQLGGPILIAQESGKRARQGMVEYLFFIALLSVNLGIINLFPIPVLDGGLIVFLGLEGIMRKPLSLKAREILQQVGIALLIMLMVFVFYNDIYRIWTKEPLPGQKPPTEQVESTKEADSTETPVQKDE